VSAARYDLPANLTSIERPFAWWARCCGEFTAVDDLEHCRDCVPAMEEVLLDQHREHVDANVALSETVSPQDPEALYHLDAALAVLHVARLLAGAVDDGAADAA